MDIQTLDMFFSAVSAIGGAVATVASIYTVKLSRDSYVIQREQREAEKPNLCIRVAPTRDGSRQLAQIMITNKSRRPAHIQAWWIGNKDRGEASSRVLPAPANGYGGTLPKILGEQERFDILIEFGDFDWRKLEQIGVMDANNKPWLAEPDEVKRFLDTAELFSPKESDNRKVPSVPIPARN